MIGRSGMTEGETKLLQRTVAGSAIHAEFGCLWGHSAIAAAQGGAQVVYTIDPMTGGWWETGDPRTGGQVPTLAHVQANIAENGLQWRVHIVQGYSSSWLVEGITPDTLLIDGDHLYEGALMDWNIAKQYTRRAILVHDYDEIHTGVKRLVDEVIRCNTAWTQVAQVDTLVVFERRDQPLVSVIIPTYNRPELLDRALASFEAQTYQHRAAVVVNDGGMDVSAICAKYPGVRYFEHGTNWGGAANARNTGLRLARGSYIAYLDDDDMWKPDHLLLLMGAVTQGARFVYSDADVIRQDKPAELWFSREYTKAGIIEQNVCATCCVLHERSLLAQVGFFDPSLPNHEDWDMWIRMSRLVDFIHVKKSTAIVDRLDGDRISDGQAKLARGWQIVFERYHDKR